MKILLVAGARPNFMKIAPLMKAIGGRDSDAAMRNGPIECILVHTGQHYDEKMSDVFFRELGIRAPDVNLEVGSGTHALQTAAVMSKFEPICVQERPDWVVVVGDVNSTMACALVCAKMGIRVAHVEAGLRSFDRAMPEEINRLVTDALANLLLTPSTDADQNLKNEGVSEDRIRCVGNIMIDALVANLERARLSPITKTLGLDGREFVYVTLHRPSNVDLQDHLRSIMFELNKLASDLPVVFPIHPRTRKMMAQFNLLNGDHPIRIVEPVGYLDSICLTECARMIITDSGGLQEESTFFRTPCLTLRPNTERPVTVRLGSNRLTSPATLSHDIQEVLNGPARRGSVPPLWDGQTAERIVDCLLSESANGQIL